MTHDNIRKSNAKVTNKSAQFSSRKRPLDPSALYNGAIAPYEDAADYVKAGVIKAIRLG